MSQLKFGFSWLGAVIFLLPMIINVVYFAAQGNDTAQEGLGAYRWVEIIEQSTRILFAIALCIIVSDKKVQWKSPFLFLAIVFLVLYYVVWIRYFAGGMEIELMSKSFLLIPLPLAVFPVLYYLFASVWIHNYIAAVLIGIFGIAHYFVSYISFR